MRHGVSGRKLNKNTSHRLAMFRNIVTSLLQHERIYTTLPKAKEVRKFTEWMITLGKRGDLHARRQAMAFIQEKSVAHKLFEEIAPKFHNRMGGYTRIVKVGFRRGDAAPMCIIELVTEVAGGTPKSKKVRQPEKAPTPTVSSDKPAQKSDEAVTEHEKKVE